jgi:hypothetical protein
VLSPDKGPDDAKVAEMMKSRRKIPMTKPGFEPRIIEMKGRCSIHFTIRTLYSWERFEPPCSTNFQIIYCAYSCLFFVRFLHTFIQKFKRNSGFILISDRKEILMQKIAKRFK